MKKVSLILSIVVLTSIILISCGADNKKLTSNEVAIGNQVWMVKNLNTDTFQNGDKIMQVKSNKEWDKAFENKQAAWCYCQFNDANEKKYGRIYNFYAITDNRKLAPANWRIPRMEDWKILTKYLDSNIDTTKMYLDENFDLEVTKAATKLKSEVWNGTNESYFNALPGGFIIWEQGDGGTGSDFYGVNSQSAWWSLNSNDYGGFGGFTLDTKGICYFQGDWGGGYYVRCIKLNN